MFGRIYTRKGDTGETSLFGGRRLGKDDLRVNAYGTLDELQAALGLARSFVSDAAVNASIARVEAEVSTAAAQLATDPAEFGRLKGRLGDAEVVRLEAEVDAFVAAHGLPEGFVIPGRDPASAAAHVARTVCRRAERLVVTVAREQTGYDNLCRYLNRLSDWLFALAWSLEVDAVVANVARDIAEECR